MYKINKTIKQIDYKNTQLLQKKRETRTWLYLNYSTFCQENALHMATV